MLMPNCAMLMAGKIERMRAGITERSQFIDMIILREMVQVRGSSSRVNILGEGYRRSGESLVGWRESSL